ncbi:amidase signature domain-containing protein [Cadophora sp. MPI-SDFR-AT-0126]|nr:amidase signature domain-containing protein [Leotiomycetes sp. MPI-SDFR-AT-0126]
MTIKLTSAVFRGMRNSSKSTHPAVALDPLTADVKLIQSYLQDGKMTSLSLVGTCLEMIESHDHYLHAMICLMPRRKLELTAQALDTERSEGKIRSPLHGIPIILKDNISTHPNLGMGTTGGALAFADMRPSSNARLVDLILEAGLIIIGKANLSELSYARGYTIPSGWSAVGGQCQSAYVRGGLDPTDTRDGHSSPSGSSAGPAVGVSAGYSPLSIGTETDGSLMAPAGRAALYSIKPTIGTVSQQGIIPISHTMDSAGPIAKTPYDLALLLDVMREPGSFDGPYVDDLDGCWSKLSIAAVDYKTWWLPEGIIKPVESATKQMHKEFRAAYDKIKSASSKFVDDIPLILPTEYYMDGRHSQFTVITAEFKQGFEEFLQSVNHTQVRTLQELVDFNIAHGDVELKPPCDDQDFLLDALHIDLTPGEYAKYLSHTRDVARRRGLDRIFRDCEVDVIIGPTDSDLPALAAGAGYPIAAVPLGYADFNGRPFGLVALAAEHQEAKLFNFMAAWEVTFGPRKPPPMLQF